jgi:hypothetical protein
MNAPPKRRGGPWQSPLNPFATQRRTQAYYRRLNRAATGARLIARPRSMSGFWLEVGK